MYKKPILTGGQVANKNDHRKKIAWLGNTHDEILDLDETSRSELGYQLYRLQCGLEPDDFKSMKTVGSGVYEIRVCDNLNKNKTRCFYVAKYEQAIFVLHVFKKDSEKTKERDLEIGKKRFKMMTDLIKKGSKND